MKNLYSIDIEKAVLASLISIENAFEKVEELIDGDDFVAGKHKIIYNAIKHLHNTGDYIDNVMLVDRLTLTDDLKNAGGDSYIAEILCNSPATLFQLEHHCKRIRYYSKLRDINAVLDNAKNVVHTQDIDLEDGINSIVSNLNDIMQGEKLKSIEPRAVTQLLGSFIDKLSASSTSGVIPFIETGFFDLDRKAPIEKGDLIVVGARPSMGKSAFAMSVLENIVGGTNKTGVFFSLEMKAELVMQRFMASRASVELTKIRSGQGFSEDDWTKIQNAVADLSYSRRNKDGSEYQVPLSEQFDLVIDDRASLTFHQMRSTLNKMVSQGREIGVIVVDYLQYMGGIDENNKVSSIGVITKNLKQIAKDFDCPVILLSQLSRSLEARPNKRPINSDLRDSGNIEQDADIIMFIYRDEVYNDKTEDKGVAEVLITKNRQGGIGKVRLGFEGRHMKFTNFINCH